MLNKVIKTIEEYNLLDKNDKILVALSGGADSVCLCLVLKELGYCVGAVHVNHNIRTEAADDASFAERFCREHNISFYLHSADVKKIAKEEKISEEVAGRNIRYQFFQKTAEEFGYNKIAVAHNMQDNAETVLFNLARGTGSKGLCAIPAVRDNIVRPLLKVTRKEIEQYLTCKNQEFVTDKTNFECNYSRNKIRNLVIPKLLEVNPSFIENVSKASDIIREENEFLDECALKIVEKSSGMYYIEKQNFFSSHKAIKARALQWAYEYASGTSKDFEKKHIDYIVDNVKSDTLGNVIELPFNTICYAEYDKICFSQKKEKESFNITLKPGEKVEIPQADMFVTAEYVSVDDVVFENNTEYFDLEVESLTLRSFEEGDKIQPLGMQSQKKLREIFINKKIPLKERNLKVVVENKEILCVLGVCRSDLFTINEKTKKVLMIKGDKLC